MTTPAPTPATAADKIIVDALANLANHLEVIRDMTTTAIQLHQQIERRIETLARGEAR